jgi:hypothetical protein
VGKLGIGFERHKGKHLAVQKALFPNGSDGRRNADGQKRLTVQKRMVFNETEHGTVFESDISDGRALRETVRAERSGQRWNADPNKAGVIDEVKGTHPQRCDLRNHSPNANPAPWEITPEKSLKLQQTVSSSRW